MEGADWEEMERLMREAKLEEEVKNKIRRIARDECGDTVLLPGKLGPKGARALALALKGTTTVRSLILQQNKIGEAGAWALAEEGLKHVPSLQVLNLGYNGLTEDGMVQFLEYLQANPPDCRIRVYEPNLKNSAPVARVLATLRHLHPETKIYFSGSILSSNDDFGPQAQAAYQQQLDLLKLLETGSVPLDTAKVFVCGDYGIGKTTMIKSLPGLSSLNALRVNVWQPPDRPEEPSERTAGIKVSELELSTANSGSQEKAFLRIYDFGGQPAYHVVHTLLVSDHNAAFVVCVDLSQPELAVKKSLWYWLRFLCTRLRQGREAVTATASGASGNGEQHERPRVFIIGTKVDKARKQRLLGRDGQVQWSRACIRRLQQAFGHTMEIGSMFLHLNCRRGNDRGFDSLRSMLLEHWKRTKKKQVLVPKVVVEVGKQLDKMRRERETPVTKEELLHRLEHDIPLWVVVRGTSKSRELFAAALRYLHTRGDVLWFSDNPALAQNVFVSPNWLLNVVMGRALAPEGVQCGGRHPRNGVVTYSDIKVTFEEHSVSAGLVINVLQHSHLCFEVPPGSDGERRFMLPSRLEEVANLSDAWRPEAGWPHYAGRRLFVEDEALALPPGFFAHVQTTLYESFGETLLLWRNAFKLTAAGVQCLGFIRDDHEVDVWIRAKAGVKSNARACIQQVFRVIEREAHGIDFETHVISVEHLQEHHQHPASYVMRPLLEKAPEQYVESTHHPASEPITEKVADLLLLNQTQTKTALDIPWQKQNYEWCHREWRLDDPLDAQLQWTGPGPNKMYTAPLPTDSDLHRWITSQVNTGHGVTLSRVEMVRSAMMLEGFHFRLQQTVERLQNRNDDKHNPFLHPFETNAGKNAMLNWLENEIRCPTDSGFVKVLPLWHGCSESVVDDIAAAGAADLSKPNEDPGFFGTGIYLARRASYAAGYATQILGKTGWVGPNSNGEHVLLLCAVCVGSVYPITRQEDYPTGVNRCHFFGKKLHRGCDAHYAQVTRASGFQATEMPGTFNFEEVVVSQEAQMPFAKVFVKVDKHRLKNYLHNPPTITIPSRPPVIASVKDSQPEHAVRATTSLTYRTGTEVTVRDVPAAETVEWGTKVSKIPKSRQGTTGGTPPKQQLHLQAFACVFTVRDRTSSEHLHELLQSLASCCSTTKAELNKLPDMLSPEEQMLPFNDSCIADKTERYRKSRDELSQTISKLDSLLEVRSDLSECWKNVEHFFHVACDEAGDDTITITRHEEIITGCTSNIDTGLNFAIAMDRRQATELQIHPEMLPVDASDLDPDAIVEACKTGSEADVFCMLEESNIHPKLVHAEDEQGIPLLWCACEAGMPEVVEELIICGADTRLRSKTGQTVREFAELKDWKLVLRALEDMHMEEPDPEVETVLASIRHGTCGDSVSLQCMSIDVPKLEEICRALSGHLPITSLKLPGCRLHWKSADVLGRCLPNLQHLTTLQVTANRLGDEGAKLLSQAFHEGCAIEILDLATNHIQDKGAAHVAGALLASPRLSAVRLTDNPVGEDGARALALGTHLRRQAGHAAASRDIHVVLADTFIANKHLQDEYVRHMETLRLNEELVRACQSNDTRHMTRLLDNGANPNSVELEVESVKRCTQNDRDDPVMLLPTIDLPLAATALHVACKHGSTSVVKLLLDRGARPIVRDVEGNTPLDVAEQHGHNTVVDMLRAASTTATTSHTTSA